MADNTLSLAALLVAFLCLATEAACAIWAPQCSSAVQHSVDVLMGGCLGIIMGTVNKPKAS